MWQKWVPWLNLLIKALNIGSKFLLLVYLAKYLSASEFGMYGVVLASINLLVYLIGLEFYTYSNRALIQDSGAGHKQIIVSHFVLVVCLYVLVLPAVYWALRHVLDDSKILSMFMVLLVFEHLNQELMRFLIALRRVILANVWFSVRSSLWGVGLMLLHYFINAQPLDLLQVLFWWMWGQIACFMLSILSVLKEIKSSPWRWANRQWLMTGIKISIPFLVATLSVRAIFAGDKYIVAHLFSPEQLAAYVFFFNLSAIIPSFLDSSIFSLRYPKLIHMQRDVSADYVPYVKRFYRDTLAMLLGINVLVLLMIQPILYVTGRQNLYENMGYFLAFLAIQSVHNLSMVPHYQLYAAGRDHQIMRSQMVACAVFFGVVGMGLLLGQGIVWIFVAMTVSFVVMLGLKIIYAQNLRGAQT